MTQSTTFERMARRDFLGIAAFATASTQVPSLFTGRSTQSTLEPWQPGEFRIHLIHTGVAESTFFIFPDGTTMLLDCGDHAAITRQHLSVPVVPGPERLAGEWIARFVRRVNPNNTLVDYMESSHWHADHCGTPKWQSAAPGIKWWLFDYARSGFGLAAEQLHFKTAIDRGWPDYNDPIPLSNGEPAIVRDHLRKLYAHLKKRDGLKVEKFQLGSCEQIAPQKSAVKEFKVFNLCANGKIAMPDGSIKNVYSTSFTNGQQPTTLNENGLSLGHIFTYGKFRYYTAGDFSDRIRTPNSDQAPLLIENELANAVGPVSAAKVNHHGHWSMPNALIQALRPKIWLGFVWDQLHMVPETLTRLSDSRNYEGAPTALIAPCVFPEPRATNESNKPYFKHLAPECIGKGCHVVLIIPPGGQTFTATFVSAEDETLRIIGTQTFAS